MMFDMAVRTAHDHAWKLETLSRIECRTHLYTGRLQGGVGPQPISPTQSDTREVR